MKTQWYKRLLSTVLVLVLVIQLVPAQVWASAVELDDSTNTSSTATSENVPVTVVGEEESLRTETEKHFRLSDGSFIAVSYGMPVHYQDASGNWEDIDNSLSLSADQSVYMATNANHATSFAANLSAGRVLASSYNGLSVSMSLLDQSLAQTMVANAVATLQTGMTLTYDRTVEAVIVSDADDQTASVMSLNGNSSDTTEGWTAEDLIPETLSSSVLYEDVYPGVDLLYTAYGYDIKEQIIVNKKQSTYRYDFFIETVGLTAVLNVDGSVAMADSAGQVIYTIPAPYMTDSIGATSNAVSYTLTQTSGGYVLTVAADATWIDSEDRVLPVAIDPTLQHDATTSNDGLYCTYVRQGAPNTSHPKYQELYFGYSASSSKEGRIFMHLAELPEVPAGCIVTDAILGMYLYDYSKVVCNNLPTAIFEVTEDKPETSSSYQSWINNMTWNTQPDYDTNNAIDYVNIKYQMGGKYLHWDVTELIKKWYETGTDNRTLAMAITESNSPWSSSYAAVACFFAYASIHPPVIAVVYRNNTGIENYYTYATLGSGEAGTAYIADASGQLKIAKGLVSYASTVNPFALSLVYNSDYFAYASDADYQPPAKMDLNMRLGAGWTLSVIQRVVAPEDLTDYLKYTDGDGTVHYFWNDPDDEDTAYYDEDGLGLKIEIEDGKYIMSDDHGNSSTFTDTYLTNISDENGNQYIINYTDKKITTIQQQNNGSTAITVATFTYSGDYVSAVTDAAGVVYTLGYSDNKLVTISQGSTQLATYAYTDNRIVSMSDSQCNYSIVYTYDAAGKISHYHEVGNDGTTGAQVDITYDGYDKTTYRDYGFDRTANTDDDIITHYLFDYAGRTSNAYSTDTNDNIIGASNAVYTGTGSVDKTNNRTLRSASIGIAAEQEMCNSGFESSISADQWTLSAGFTNANTKPHTGACGLVGTSTVPTATLTAAKSSRTLYAGQTYTLSAYVHTSGLTISATGGVSLTVTDGTNIWTSDVLNYQTSENVDDGWTRISVTFTAQTTVAHTVCVSATGVTGTFYVDDFQLERGEAPSNRNLLENGNFQIEDYAWTFGSSGEYQTNVGLERYGELAMAPMISSSFKTTSANISQTVAVNLPATETFVLSGWAQGNSVPDYSITEGQNVAKAFGLRAIVTYDDEDETQETFYASFNADVTDWQFTSLTIVPTQTTLVVKSITVVCAFEQNLNTVYFDNISLVRQTAQSMRYDADGNLLCASTTGITADQNEYDDNGNLIKTVTGTGSTIEYSYDETYEHRLVSSTNSLTTNSYSYDSFGNVLSSILSANEGSDLQIVSQSVYTNSGNLAESVTDSSGITTSYAYSADQNKMLGLPSAVTDANGTTTNITYDSFGRTTKTTVASLATLRYTYSDGNLTIIVRQCGSDTLYYRFTYDAFGNMTMVQVGNQTLCSYEYASGNGLLLKQTYANGDTVTFTYDYLGRIKTETLDDGRVVTYTYNGEGQLYSVEETGGTSPAAYYYTYDSNGRLVSSEKRSTSGESLMRVHLYYNEAGQIVGQTWNIGGTEYTEGYTYNTEDGTLNTMTTATGQTLQMNYDALRRLSSVSSDLYTKSYLYRHISDTQTTTQVTGLSYTGLTGSLNFYYLYDALGNISSHMTPDGEIITYTYDAQGQLRRAEGDETYTYTYDAAGNILTANGHTYTYGNANWTDLLTAFDGQTIAYDTSGNPLSYYNGTRWTLTWANGRNLVHAKGNKYTLTYTYDADGQRTSKTVNGVVHNYYYASGKLMRETWGTNVLDFCYDASGNPYALTYNGVTYYYITNLQGDVMYLVDGTGATVASYEYDPYGNIVSATGTMAEINPLRYRGYYFDSDTRFYYLQSRYYDPVIGRFINADGYASTGQGILGYNMFAYCGNNPIMGVDPTGCWNWGGFWAGVATVVVGVAIIAATVATAGAAAPLAAAAISTVGTAVGAAVTATGAATTYAAATETPMVVDVSVTDGYTNDKHGYSVVIDFESDSVSFDTYYHYGKTSAGYSFAYGVGFVDGYDEPGDYGGYFIDGTASYSHNGIDYGIDVCTDPSEPFAKCSAALLTVGVSAPNSKPVNVGVDYYVPISYIEWE